MKRGRTYDWLPLWRNKWLQGSTRFELEPDERGVFIDFLCLAGNDDGFIRANPETPYPSAYLANLLCIPVELLERTIKKCLSVGKLACPRDDGVLFVANWEGYQLDPRRKREAMEGVERGGEESNNGIPDEEEEEKMKPRPRLEDTESAAGYPADLCLVPGGMSHGLSPAALRQRKHRGQKCDKGRDSGCDSVVTDCDKKCDSHTMSQPDPVDSVLDRMLKRQVEEETEFERKRTKSQ